MIQNILPWFVYLLLYQISLTYLHKIKLVSCYNLEKAAFSSSISWMLVLH